MVEHESTINTKIKIELELRSDDSLYIDGQKVVTYLSEVCIEGHELRKELESGKRILLNDRVLYYLYHNPELVPRHWRKSEKGDIKEICLYGSILRRIADGKLFVSRLCWASLGFHWDVRWIGDDCNS